MADIGESTLSLALEVQLPLAILWVLTFPIQLYVLCLYVRNALACGGSPHVTVVENHERLRDRHYLISRLVMFSPPMAFLTTFTWSSPIKAAWAWFDNGPFEGCAFALLVLIAVGWCCAFLFGTFSMLSDGVYIDQLSPAFFCQRCGHGWRRFIGRNPIRRKHDAKGPPHHLVELCNQTIYSTFGGEKVDGLLHAKVANALLAKLTESGQRCEWLYGLCNSHLELAYNDGNEESARTSSIGSAYELPEIFVVRCSADSCKSREAGDGFGDGLNRKQTRASMSCVEPRLESNGIALDDEASLRDFVVRPA